MSVPNTYEMINLGMSNFDHSIDNGLEDALVGKNVFGVHSGWNFMGHVYHKDGQYHEDIWQYGSYKETKSEPSLKELMETVNDIYGWR